jgi:uncharacterized protein YbbC (DUF1343 family)
MDMDNVKNFVDEKTSRLIIQALCDLEFNDVLKLSEKSGVTVSRLQDFVDGDEQITQLDKGKLIIHLVNLAEMSNESKQLEKTEESYTSLKDFQNRKAG